MKEHERIRAQLISLNTKLSEEYNRRKYHREIEFTSRLKEGTASTKAQQAKRTNPRCFRRNQTNHLAALLRWKLVSILHTRWHKCMIATRFEES
jgi:DNA polymerase III delta prime subunit